MKEDEVRDYINNRYRTMCCNSEWYRKGRADLRCKKCDADVTFDIVLLHDALIDDQ